MRPRTQAALDLILYFVYFVLGILALIYAGYDYAALSWRISEHSTMTADGPPIYHFKTVIPVAGALIMLQGLAEIVRCIVCLRTANGRAACATSARSTSSSSSSRRASTSTRAHARRRSRAPRRSRRPRATTA